MRFYLNDFLTPLQVLFKRSHLQTSDIFDLFVTKPGSSHATAATFQALLKHYLQLELSPDELSLLNHALLGFYGESATTQGLSKQQFCEFFLKNFHVHTLDQENFTLAHKI